jgi:hypothetical protein
MYVFSTIEYFFKKKLKGILWTNPNPSKVPQKDYLFISMSYVGSMFASSAALAFLNYPTQVLGKSCKMIPGLNNFFKRDF